MAFETVAGGFKLSDEEQQLVNTQRAITKAINDRFVQVGAVFLKQSNKNPFSDDWYKQGFKDTNLQSWIDDPDKRYHNVGFNMQLGWMDIDIDADDPEYARCIIAAMDYLHIDTRFQFGRLSKGVASHVLVQLGEAESENFDQLKRFEPREFFVDGKRYHTQLRSYPTNIKAENLAREAKQTVMPGSIYTHKQKADAADISVWWTAKGPAEDVRKIAATTPRRVNFNEVLRAITFGTFLYFVRPHWIEGGRQTAAQKLGGWLARVVHESQAINNHEALASQVYCPVDDDSIAEKLLEFVCDQCGDDEKHMRKRVYADARAKLERNPDAKIPGWPAVQQMLGGHAVQAFRAVFSPGSDVSVLTQMAERYIYDESDNQYIDRLRFPTNGNFVHDGAALERRHKGDIVRVGGKPREAFRVYESSDMRKRVGMRDLYPNLDPGGIYRINSLGEVLSDDDEDDETALAVFNTWKGWPVKPATEINTELMADLIERFDRLLGYLTQDNHYQIDWAKKWIAWTFQNPGIKQQIAWVVVGDQGVGKSWLFSVFLKQLMGSLWGSASPKVLESDFSVEPFINKMFVFIDEAKFHSESGVDEIKKLIRSIDVPGAEKFQSSRNYRLFARLAFASNRVDIGVGQANLIDRALFYTRTYDRSFLRCNESEFRNWAESLKPWFDEFTALMQKREVLEHYMRYFMDIEVERHEIESIKHSSSTDEAIVMAGMNWARKIAKYIIEEGRIIEDMAIEYPFTPADLNRRVLELQHELGMRNVQGARVLAEFEQAGVIERVVVKGAKKLRFTHKIGTLTELFGAAISVKLQPQFEFNEDDYGLNDADGSRPLRWKGTRKGVVEERGI